MKTLLLSFILILSLTNFGCSSSETTSNKNTFRLQLPKELSALNLNIKAKIITSLDPNTSYDLIYDNNTQQFTGEFTVPKGSVFDLTIIYSAIDPVSGQEMQIAQYTRKDIHADSDNVAISYSGDEANWNITYNISPGSQNELDLDGDGVNNLTEIRIGTDPTLNISVPQILVKINDTTISTNSPIPETDNLFNPTLVTLDASKITLINDAANYSWNCTAPGGFIFTSKKIIDQLTLPNINRTEDGRVILCNLTITNSINAILSTFQLPLTIGFVNQPPVVTNVTLSQYTDTNTGLPSPKNFKINWLATDPDGISDLSSYDLSITRRDSASNDILVTKCTGLNKTQISFNDNMATNCSQTPKGHGELVNPFRLGALEKYLFTVTAHDTDSIGSSSTISAFVSDDNLVGSWDFEDGTTNDTSGESDNLGTLVTNGPAYSYISTDTSPIMNKTLSLSQAKDRLSITDTSGNNLYDLGIDDFTISLWYKDTQANSGTKTFIEKYKAAGANTSGFQMGKLANGVPFFNTPICDSVASTFSVNQNTWAHFVATRSHGKLNLYVNGELAATKYCPDNLTTAATLTFACNSAEHVDCVNTNNGEEFNGQLDNINIYKRSLSVDEVRRQCRSSDPTGTTCPNEQKPIILQPETDVTVPFNHVFYSWRGEKDPQGNLLYPNLNYSLTYSYGTAYSGIYTQVNKLPDPNYLFDGYYIEKNPNVIKANQFVEIHVTSDGVTPYQANRTYYTSPNMAAWWQFEGNYNDSSVNALNFDRIQQGLDATTFTTNDLLGKKLLFDGNDYIFFNSSNNFNFGTGDFTISFYYYPLNTTDQILFDKSDTLGNGIRITYNSDASYSVYTNTCGMVSGTRLATPPILNGGWSSVLVNRQNGQMSLYVDGALQASKSCPSSITSTAQFTIGHSSPNFSNNPNIALGYMDDVFVLSSSIRDSAIFNEHCAYDASILNTNQPPATPENSIAVLDEACLQ